MKPVVAASVFVLILAVVANANTGYFAGSGQTITLTKTEQVQLISEEVTIRPNCGWRHDMDTVDYRCTFVLKNLDPKPVKVQVGFPLDSQFVQQAKQQPNTVDLVLNCHFIARDSDTTYQVRYVPTDTEHKYARLFVWDMAFRPGETRIVHVAYQLPMSEGLGSTRKPEIRQKEGFPTYEKRWHAYLEMAFIEQFQYVTETGKSWAGPIEKATFRVDTESLTSCLSQRPLLDGEPPEPQLDLPDWMPPFTIPVKAGPVHESISPEGGEYDSDKGMRTWKYQNYKPGPPFRFKYYVVAMPRTAADCDSWVRHILGRKPTKTDLAELREIAAAFYGITPRLESARKFVEQQVWYHPKNGLQETGLDTEQQAILKRLDAMADATK